MNGDPMTPPVVSRLKPLGNHLSLDILMQLWCTLLQVSCRVASFRTYFYKLSIFSMILFLFFRQEEERMMMLHPMANYTSFWKHNSTYSGARYKYGNNNTIVYLCVHMNTKNDCSLNILTTCDDSWIYNTILNMWIFY